MTQKSYRQAINEALFDEMRRDPRVVVMGEGICGGAGTGTDDAWGGPLGVTKGLLGEFGHARLGRGRRLTRAYAGRLVARADDILHVGGVPAGFSELDRRQTPEIELSFFGLAPEFIGQGIGAYFLNWTVRRAWEHAPTRLWMHTDTLDHPRALGLYQRMGFVVYERQAGTADPDPNPAPPPD